MRRQRTGHDLGERRGLGFGRNRVGGLGREEGSRGKEEEKRSKRVEF